MADNTTTTPNASAQAAQPAKRNGKRKLMLSLLVAAVAVGSAGAYFYHESYGRFYEETDDAYVDGNLIQLTPQTAGTVISITADNGDFVEQGQTLVEFDPADTEVALQSSEANLAKAVRQVRGLYSDVDNYKAQLEARKVDVQQAQADYQRRQKLAKGGAISQEELAHARDALSAAERAVTSAKQKLDSALALVDDTHIASHPEVMAAAASLRQAYLNHARSTLVAPVSGYIAQRTVQVGSRVQAGAPLLAVVPLDDVWIDANFKETQLKDMRIGQPVEIHADLYGSDVRYRGTVESLGVGTGSAFSLLPAQNASGNWIKIVQRLPVRIRLQSDNLDKHPLRIGLSTTVSVDLHDQDGPVLAEKAQTKPRYATDVYQHQLSEADALIAQLIHDNGPVAEQVGMAH